MNRHASKIRKKEKNEINKKLAKTDDKEDIVKCVQNLLPEYDHDYNHQFVLVEKIDTFVKSFKNVEIQPEKPIFVIFAKAEKRWVLFCIILKKDGSKIVLYKDPCGELVPAELEEKIEKKFFGVEFIVQIQSDQKVDDERSYRPFTVGNLKIMLEFLKTKPEDFEEFSKLEFIHFTRMNSEESDKVVELTTKLGKNKEFKKALKDFVNKMPLDLCPHVLTYKQIMEEELEKGEENANLDRIEQAKKMYFAEKSLIKFQEDYKLNIKTIGEEIKSYDLDIQTNFPDEMKKFEEIFQLLDASKVNEKLFAVLKNISEILDIDFEKIKVLYEFKEKQYDKKTDEKLSPEDIDDILKKLPTMKKTSPENYTPLDQLLNEITLGMNQDHASSGEEIKKIEAKFHLAKTYSEKWKNADVKAINLWAKNTKGSLGTSDEDICETVAIMDRAFHLLTGGYRLRDTQILSILIFFHQNQRGRLCQIKTGEGKTITVSLLAVIRVLQGQTVDVITSNTILARDGVEETRTFYSTFGLTVSTNNHDGMNFKVDYTADVLYGSISNFQFDFLRDSFENYNIRSGRKFGTVILDEVDSMLVDNGGYIAKLSSPYPGMECLRYIYIKIWQELYKAEESLAKKCQDEIKKLMMNPDKNEAQIQCEKLFQKKIFNDRKIIKDKIRKSNPTKVPLIPKHLEEYVEKMLDTWIKNALHAKYKCHEHEQYRIVVDDIGEKIVVPVDYLNTGVTLRNTIWSNGLHQFVQLKHNLHLTFESLTSSFISNVGYIKKYQDKNIFGLTGTLGSKAEQELLSSIYNVDYARIPTYKKKKFEELPGLIVEDKFWSTQITLEILAKIDEERAVLVICETEQDLLVLKENLQVLQNEDFRIRVYAHEDDVEETHKTVDVGDVILSTNIAGRGTNFKTEKSLEEKGGLHVCVGFLSCNSRVEEQAFGRTSRQGNRGTAQIIIRQKEVDALRVEETDFKKIKEERDCLEKERLKEVSQVLVQELNFKDKLFSYFSEFHRQLKQKKMTEEFRFVLQDLKKFWAFWLEKKNFKVDSIRNTTPKIEFERFVEEAKPIINGMISHNPFYCIGLTNCYLENDDRNKAKDILTRALSIGGEKNYDLLSGVHLKLFELAIASGNQTRKCLGKILANIISIFAEVNPSYKEDAVKHLNDAKTSIHNEIAYIEQYLTENDKDFAKILKDQDVNLFLKHIYSRLYYLRTHEGNIEQLVKEIQEASEGVDLSGKAPTSLENFAKVTQDKDIGKTLTSDEISELHSIGVDALYSLKEVHGVPQKVLLSALGQISAGIAALACGICFFPFFPFMSFLAGTLISEGIMDIVMEVLFRNGDEEFDSAQYMKDKFISYGTSLITFGIGAITQCVKILSKALSYCRKFSSFLRKSKYLKTLCSKLANLVDRLGNVLEKMLISAKFSKLTKAEQLEKLVSLQKSGNLEKLEHLGGLKKLEELQRLKDVGKLRELTRMEVFVDFGKKFVLDTGKKVATTVIEKQIVMPLLHQVFKDLIKKLHEKFKTLLKNSIKSNESLVSKLRTTSTEEIDKLVEKFMKGDETLDTIQNIGSEILRNFNNPVINILIKDFEMTKDFIDLRTYASKICSFLEDSLPGGANDNNVDQVLEKITTEMAGQMFDLLMKVVKNEWDIVTSGVTFDWFSKKKAEENKSHLELSLSTSTNPGESDRSGQRHNPYKILDLRPDAPLAEVKKKYRRLALQVHPDKNRNDPQAKEKFQVLLEAYEEIVKGKSDSKMTLLSILEK